MGSRGARSAKISWGQIANVTYHIKLSMDRIQRKSLVFFPKTFKLYNQIFVLEKYHQWLCWRRALGLQ